MSGVVAPFDTVAAEYDGDFSARRLGRLLRAAVWARLAPHLQPGMRLLELNCGTGEDALWLAGQGVQVTATDASLTMLTVAGRKADAAGLGERVTCQPLDLAHLPPEAPDNAPYDAVLSNFGGLNCLPAWEPVGAWLAGQIRPGGWAALCVMGPWCPWEIGWHLLHGEPARAMRRLRHGGTVAHVGGSQVRVWYPSARRLAQAFAPWFRPLETVGIGVLLPPSYLWPLVERWPQGFARLARLEARLADRFPATHLNDHYLLVLQRVGEAP